MRNIVLAGLVLALIVAAAVAAQTKVLVLKDGREFTGEVTKTADGYRVKTKHAVLTFTSDQVASVTAVAAPQDEYKQRLEKIDPKDAEARLALGRWAYKKGMLKIAKKELIETLKLDPELEMAKLLLRRVNAELNRTTRPSTTRSTSNAGVVNLSVPEKWLVTQEDVYRIRLAEFKLANDPSGIVDTTATVRFRNKVIERFIDLMQGRSEDFDARKFRAMSSFDKLKLILSKTEDDSIRKDILLRKDPKVMNEFRTKVWPLVASRCGSLACHGAAKGKGHFKLLNVATRNERLDYANFMIFSQYATGQTKMLNRDNAGDSLLLHYGLPLDDEKVKYKHPAKKAIPVVFTTVGDSNYKSIEKWIGSLRGPPYGDSYDVKYQAPFGPKRKPRVILDLDDRAPAGPEGP